MPGQVKRVFLSSTGRDLAEYREAVAQAINALDDFKVVRMEDFGARDWAADDFCRRKVGECDVYLGLIGHFYGSIPEGQERSFTEREYDAAVELGKPMLLFVARDDFSLPAHLIVEAAATWAQAQAFRARARKDRVSPTFGSGEKEAEGLAREVATALLQLDLEKPAPTIAAARPPDLAALERRYLDHLLDTHRYLDIRGMGVSDRTSLRMELLELYVPLKGRCALPEGETWSEELRLAGRKMTKEEREEIGKIGRPQPVLEVLQKNDGVIVLGDPGAGKSTFLKYLALTLARGKGEDLGLGDRLPVLVPISPYADKLASGSLRLDHFIAEYFRARVGDLAIEAFLGPALESGRALVLLDGLDEVRDRALQLTVVEQAREFYNFHRRAGNKFVLSSRLVGYKEVRPTAEGLVECTLVDFDDEEIEQFLDRWVVVQERAVLGETGAASRSAAQEKVELQEALRHNEAVRALAANPLLLTILALMKRQGVTLPEQRVRLYATYVRALLETWNPVRGLEKRAVKPRNALETLKVLTPLALWIHETSPGVGVVRRRALLEKLAAILKEKGEDEPAEAAADFLSDLSDSCLLLERGNDRYGFIHLTFLEYLAGCELVRLDQLGPDQLFQTIALRISEPAWREVLLLAIGHLGAVSEREISAGELLKRLVRDQPGESGEAVIVAGKALADLSGVGLSSDVQDTVTVALYRTMRDDLSVRPVRRASAGRVLARVGDLRREVMTIEGMRFCWVPPGPFLMGNKREEETFLGDDPPQREIVLHYGYWVGLYPVTSAQYQVYLERRSTAAQAHEAFRGEPNAPMVQVTWREATEFCAWLMSMAEKNSWLPMNWHIALPSESEWEKACRGGLQLPVSQMCCSWEQLGAGGLGTMSENARADRRYPWGSSFDANRVNSRETGIRQSTAVGCFPSGASPLGVEELCGNVWEWTRSPRDGYLNARSTSRELIDTSIEPVYGLRGGSWLDPSQRVRCSNRAATTWDDRADHIGFRLVVRPAEL